MQPTVSQNPNSHISISERDAGIFRPQMRVDPRLEWSQFYRLKWFGCQKNIFQGLLGKQTEGVLTSHQTKQYRTNPPSNLEEINYL